MRTSTTVEDHDPSNRERGSSLVEYAMLVGLIAAVCVSAVTVLGHRVESDLATGPADGQAQVMGSDSKESEAAQEKAAEEKAAKEKAAEEQAVAEQAVKDAAEKRDGEDAEKKPAPEDDTKPVPEDEKKQPAPDEK